MANTKLQSTLLIKQPASLEAQPDLTPEEVIRAAGALQLHLQNLLRMFRGTWGQTHTHQGHHTPCSQQHLDKGEPCKPSSCCSLPSHTEKYFPFKQGETGAGSESSCQREQHSSCLPRAPGTALAGISELSGKAPLICVLPFMKASGNVGVMKPDGAVASSTQGAANPSCGQPPVRDVNRISLRCSSMCLLILILKY